MVAHLCDKTSPTKLEDIKTVDALEEGDQVVGGRIDVIASRCGGLADRFGDEEVALAGTSGVDDSVELTNDFVRGRN